MLSHYYGLSIFFFIFMTIDAIEYVYPVASMNNGTTIFLIHQSTSDQIQLYAWDTKTNTLEQKLWSLFNPAGFQLLYDNSGFSFIDNGRLRIQFFNKRSPKTIDFDEPIISINSVQWIDIHSCYCSAQQGNDYALFNLYDNGAVVPLISCKNKDFLYPQKVDAYFFYIERDKTDIAEYPSYHIIHTQYPINNETSSSNNVFDTAEIIIDFKQQPIVFLHMSSVKEGFVIEHQKTIDTHDKTILFFYHHIIKKGDIWHKNKLFSFNIPTNLLVHGNKETLYESLLPLLPHKVNDKIYFVTAELSENYFLKPYYYDLTTNVCTKIILPSIQGHYFVPQLYGNKLYCGGTKQLNQEPLISFLT